MTLLTLSRLLAGLARGPRAAGTALLIALCLGSASGAAAAETRAQLRDCDTWQANARNIVFPVSQSTRSFANGAVRLVWLDTGGEPVCCSSHLMVLLPSPEEPGDICVFVSRQQELGWTGFDLQEAVAQYDPDTGLEVRIPAGLYEDGLDDPVETLRLRIDQQSGVVEAWRAPQ